MGHDSLGSLEGICFICFMKLSVIIFMDPETLGQNCYADLAGYRWQHSREMLRPNFVRTQIGDVGMFEKHVGHLIQAIPKDGSQVDLQELFFQFSLDTATDLLFGESTNTLAPGFADAEITKFVDAYASCLQALGGDGLLKEEHGYLETAWGFLGQFLPSRQFRQHVNIVNGTFVHIFSSRICPPIRIA